MRNSRKEPGSKPAFKKFNSKKAWKTIPVLALLAVLGAVGIHKSNQDVAYADTTSAFSDEQCLFCFRGADYETLLEKINKQEELINSLIAMVKNINVQTASSSSGSGAASTSTSQTESSKSFVENFNTSGVLEEAGSMSASKNASWWVNSGAYLYFKDGIGSTIKGALPSNDKWRVDYNGYNPGSTDSGYYPQNIFRLITKTKWQNSAQEAYFKIDKYNLSKDSHRNASNGILLMSRYYDSDNLYYFGLRVDGDAVIKKKIGGAYYTVATKKVFDGTYNIKTNPNLIPLNKWIGIRSEVTNNSDGSVNLKLYADLNNSDKWTLVIDTKDDGKKYGGKALTNSAYAGIRTDFMDVNFENYAIGEIK